MLTKLQWMDNVHDKINIPYCNTPSETFRLSLYWTTVCLLICEQRSHHTSVNSTSSNTPNRIFSQWTIARGAREGNIYNDHSPPISVKFKNGHFDPWFTKQRFFNCTWRMHVATSSGFTWFLFYLDNDMWICFSTNSLLPLVTLLVLNSDIFGKYRPITGISSQSFLLCKLFFVVSLKYEN